MIVFFVSSIIKVVSINRKRSHIFLNLLLILWNFIEKNMSFAENNIANASQRQQQESFKHDIGTYYI
jgi:hypothetical protein